MRKQINDRALTLQIAMLIGGGLLLVVSMLVVLRVQANAQSWLLGHHRWMQAQVSTADALELYASTGDPRILARARKAIEIPMGARAARLASEQDPPDRAAARRGLLKLGMDPRDIDGMSWLYITLRHAPFAREAVAAWLQAEPAIDQLVSIGNEMEAASASGPLTPVQEGHYHRRIAAVRAHIEACSRDFSKALVSGLRMLRGVLTAVSLLFTVIAVLFMLILRRVMGRILGSERWLWASFEQSHVGMLQLSADGSIRHANRVAVELLGTDVNDAGGHKRHRLQDFVVYRDQRRFLELLERGNEGDGGDAESGDAPRDSEFMLVDPQGRERIVRASLSEVRMESDASRAGLRFAMMEDVTESHRMRAELARQARYDDLTGLLNRGEVLRRIGWSMGELKEGRLASFSVCLVDLDRFRYINESAGLRVGDRILQVIAHRLHEAMGNAGESGRLGGDQFALILPRMDADEAMAFAARIAEQISKPDRELADRMLTPTASIGVMEVDASYLNASEVLAAADAACQQAKKAGRNRVRLLLRSERPTADLRGPGEWASEIRAAISSGRMELDAQRIDPCQPALADRQVELLLRMRDASGTRIAPGDFLPTAEMYGLSTDIDREVLRLAAQQIMKYRARGGAPMTFFVNLSPSSVADPEFGLFVRHMLEGEPGLAQMMCFEITESGVMANLAQATAFMDMVRGHGAKVALDDFGTGQSSFAQLRVLPIDIVKIDGSFVRGLDRDATSGVLIRSICEMSHVLGKRTVVEWIERPEDLQRMQKLGADYAQGFGLHAPEPLEGFLDGRMTASA